MTFSSISTDSVYSERYLGSPSGSNLKSYESSSVIGRPFSPSEGSRRRLLLVHGTRDDNVHVQNSMALARALVERGVHFQQLVREL